LPSPWGASFLNKRRKEERGQPRVSFLGLDAPHAEKEAITRSVPIFSEEDARSYFLDGGSGNGSRPLRSKDEEIRRGGGGVRRATRKRLLLSSRKNMPLFLKTERGRALVYRAVRSGGKAWGGKTRELDLSSACGRMGGGRC